MTPVRCHEPAYPMCVHWDLAKGSAPSTPARRFGATHRFRPRGRCGRRRAACPSRPGAPGDPQRSAAHGRPRQSTRWRGFSTSFRPSVTCRGRPCGQLLPGQPEGLARIPSTKRRNAARRSVVAENRRIARTTSPTTDPPPEHRPRRRDALETRRQRRRRNDEQARASESREQIGHGADHGEIGKRQTRDPALEEIRTRTRHQTMQRTMKMRSQRVGREAERRDRTREWP